MIWLICFILRNILLFNYLRLLILKVIIGRPKFSASNATVEWLGAIVPSARGMEMLQNGGERTSESAALESPAGHFPGARSVATSERIGPLQMASKCMRHGIARRCRRVAPALSLC
jgi:hypothetical protein